MGLKKIFSKIGPKLHVKKNQKSVQNLHIKKISNVGPKFTC